MAQHRSRGGALLKRREQIKLTADERAALLSLAKACTLATIGPQGFPQLTAMWFALIEGKFHFSTYGKSQKVRNLERNRKCSVLVEDGASYAELRGYSVEGDAEVIADPALTFHVMREISKRYMGFDPGMAGPEVERATLARIAKRVVVRVHAVREISWDHRKLGGTY
jgi:PPOX class probable F420-dependent enzyme